MPLDRSDRLFDLLARLDGLQDEVSRAVTQVTDALGDAIEAPGFTASPRANAWHCPACRVSGQLAQELRSEEARDFEVLKTTCPICRGPADLAHVNLFVYRNEAWAPSVPDAQLVTGPEVPHVQ